MNYRGKIIWDAIELQALHTQPLALYCLDFCKFDIHAVIWSVLYQLDLSSDLQDDKLYCITKSNVHEGPNGVTHAAGNALGSMRQKPSEWNDGDSVHGEHNGGADPSKIKGYAYWYEYQ